MQRRPRLLSPLQLQSQTAEEYTIVILQSQCSGPAVTAVQAAFLSQPFRRLETSLNITFRSREQPELNSECQLLQGVPSTSRPSTITSQLPCTTHWSWLKSTLTNLLGSFETRDTASKPHQTNILERSNCSLGLITRPHRSDFSARTKAPRARGGHLTQPSQRPSQWGSHALSATKPATSSLVQDRDNDSIHSRWAHAHVGVGEKPNFACYTKGRGGASTAPPQIIEPGNAQFPCC
ncbi:hypothetical protein B0T14DRAFT_256152 [Immersiella caudata]|uniref:Uncharacterized protein n=1 Tax=Immersiella caudata TaxID=314043 RepID=A0AA40BXC5_9PEZI|nr:hypothetical protein B0T14DRAFT_256152 [Immersiella caudata]